MNYRILLIEAPEENTDIFQFTKDNVQEVRRNSESLRNDVKYLTKCNLVVTTAGFHEHPNGSNLLVIARMLKIEVIHSSKFTAHVQQGNNTQD